MDNEIGIFINSTDSNIIIRYIIPDGIDPNIGTPEIPDTPILIQALTVCDYASALKLIQELNADVNIKESSLSEMAEYKPSNSTPLMTLVAGITENYALEGLNILHLLLEKKANINDQDVMGFTALHLLVNNNKITANTKSAWIDILLKHGADRNIEMAKHGTPKSLAKLIKLDIIQPEVYEKL
jgi:hypothetical protein